MAGVEEIQDLVTNLGRLCAIALKRFVISMDVCLGGLPSSKLFLSGVQKYDEVQQRARIIYFHWNLFQVLTHQANLDF